MQLNFCSDCKLSFKLKLTTYSKLKNYLAPFSAVVFDMKLSFMYCCAQREIPKQMLNNTGQSGHHDGPHYDVRLFSPYKSRDRPTGHYIYISVPLYMLLAAA